MFDTTGEVAARVRTREGLQELVVRWPTEEEWIERGRGRRTNQRQLGQGATEIDVVEGDSDLKLYNAIRLNGSANLTAGEATMFMETIAECRGAGAELGPAEAVITLRVMGGQEVKHTITIPSAEAIFKTKKLASKVVNLPHNLYASKTFMGPWLKLYEECNGHSSDYTGPIPAIHKETAMRELAEAMEREMTAGPDESPI